MNESALLDAARRFAPGHEDCARCIAPDACPGCAAQAVQPGYCLDCEKHDEALADACASALRTPSGGGA